MFRIYFLLALCPLSVLARPVNPFEASARTVPKVLKILDGPGESFWQLRGQPRGLSLSWIDYSSPLVAPGSQSTGFHQFSAQAAPPLCQGRFAWRAIYSQDGGKREENYQALCEALRRVYPKAVETDETVAGDPARGWTLGRYRVLVTQRTDELDLEVDFEKIFRPQPLTLLLEEWQKNLAKHPGPSKLADLYNYFGHVAADNGHPRGEVMRAYKQQLPLENDSTRLYEVLLRIHANDAEIKELQTALTPGQLAAVREVARQSVQAYNPPPTPAPAVTPPPPPPAPVIAEPRIQIGDYVRFRLGRNSENMIDQHTYYILSEPDPSSPLEQLRQYRVVCPLYGGQKSGWDYLKPADVKLMARVVPELYLCKQCQGHGHGYQREASSVGWQQTLDASVYKYEPGKTNVQYVDQYCYPCKGTGWKASP